MNPPTADDLDDPDDQAPSAAGDHEPCIRLSIDPAEPMACWLAII